MPNGEQQLAMVTPEVLEQLRKKAQKNLEEKVEGTNRAMRTYPPEAMINRLKMVLYRTMPMMTAVGGNENRTVSESMLLELLEQLCNSISDSIKWIAFHSDIDYNAPFGDDSLIIKFEDIILGVSLDQMEVPERTSSTGLDDILLEG